MRDKEISVSSNIRLNYTICGILWIVNAICIWIGYKPLQKIGAICLVITLLYTLFTYTRKHQKNDEMAEHNLYVAKSFANSVTTLLLSLCVLLVSMATVFWSDTIVGVSVEFILDRIIYPGICFILGVNHFIIGILFKKLDEE